MSDLPYNSKQKNAHFTSYVFKTVLYIYNLLFTLYSVDQIDNNIFSLKLSGGKPNR